MRSKSGVRHPVLSLRTLANAIVEGGLKPVEIGARNVGTFIRHQSRQTLPHALAHDARLAVVHGKPFFHQNDRDVRGKSLDAALELFAARKREIVGITGVFGSGRSRQSGEPAIHTIGANIR
jgi:hypothetical protein